MSETPGRSLAKRRILARIRVFTPPIGGPGCSRQGQDAGPLRNPRPLQASDFAGAGTADARPRAMLGMFRLGASGVESATASKGKGKSMKNRNAMQPLGPCRLAFACGLPSRPATAARADAVDRLETSRPGEAVGEAKLGAPPAKPSCLAITHAGRVRGHETPSRNATQRRPRRSKVLPLRRSTQRHRGPPSRRDRS